MKHSSLPPARRRLKGCNSSLYDCFFLPYDGNANNNPAGPNNNPAGPPNDKVGSPNDPAVHRTKPAYLNNQGIMTHLYL